MTKTRKMTKEILKKQIKKNEICNCSVKLTRLTMKNLVFEKALFRMHGISVCTVNLHRLSKGSIALQSKPTKKKLLSTPKAKSVRFQVPWLPTTAIVTSSAKTKDASKSAGKRRQSLSSYNDVIGSNDTINSSDSSKIQKTKLLPARHQRSLSMLGERPKPTNEDFHSELLGKLNSPNRSLLPAGRRSIADSVPETVPEWKKIFEEFKEKMAERERQRNEGK